MPEATRENGTDRRQLPTRTAAPVSIRTATPRIEAYPADGAYATERRDLASRQALSRRIAMEYDELSRGRGATIKEIVAIHCAYREVLQRAAVSDLNLMVMGAQGSGVVELMLYGSNTQHVVRAATCPVLTVRA